MKPHRIAFIEADLGITDASFIDEADFLSRWKTRQALTREIGHQRLVTGNSATLLVHPALAPGETNALINPGHDIWSSWVSRSKDAALCFDQCLTRIHLTSALSARPKLEAPKFFHFHADLSE